MGVPKVGDCHITRKDNAKGALVASAYAIGLMAVLAKRNSLVALSYFLLELRRFGTEVAGVGSEP